ncbi:hypothetical protein AAG570_005388 [Ranatra chinensis]|uniref:Uncharacterized protein n=1 Tax=Ranatra chinensis TaxID=642074 RepID=A0ABD0Y0A2_9HEMI
MGGRLLQIAVALAALVLLPERPGAYLVVLSENDGPGVFFEAGVKAYDSHSRHYTIDANRSAAFVRKLVGVDPWTGSVYLKQRPRCDGLLYPNLFTVYIDSVSNGTLDYVSLPLRILIRGCADLLSLEGNLFININLP